MVTTQAEKLRQAQAVSRRVRVASIEESVKTLVDLMMRDCGTAEDDVVVPGVEV